MSATDATADRAPACVNCGGQLETAMYCATCVQGDGESWYTWRVRLLQIRRALAGGARRP